MTDRHSTDTFSNIAFGIMMVTLAIILVVAVVTLVNGVLINHPPSANPNAGTTESGSVTTGGGADAGTTTGGGTGGVTTGGSTGP